MATGGMTTRHDDGDGRNVDGRHDDGKGQQGDGRHDDGNGLHGDGDGRHNARQRAARQWQGAAG
jgi:hypothetical protein